VVVTTGGRCAPARRAFIEALFFKIVPVENILGKINAEKEKCQGDIEEYLRIEHFLKTDERTKGDRSLPLWLAKLNYGKLWRASVITWVEVTIKSLEIRERDNLPQNDWAISKSKYSGLKGRFSR
jgi:hypothetical protein